MPSEARVEGGDVMLCDDFIFVGYSRESDFNKYQVARTNKCAVDFLQHSFQDLQLLEHLLCLRTHQ